MCLCLGTSKDLTLMNNKAKPPINQLITCLLALRVYLKPKLCKPPSTVIFIYIEEYSFLIGMKMSIIHTKFCHLQRISLYIWWRGQDQLLEYVGFGSNSTTFKVISFPVCKKGMQRPLWVIKRIHWICLIHLSLGGLN